MGADDFILGGDDPEKIYKKLFCDIGDWFDFKNGKISFVEFAEKSSDKKLSPSDIEFRLRIFSSDILHAKN
jgi:hypothetical protein